MLTCQYKEMIVLENKIDEINNESKLIVWSSDYNEKIHTNGSSHWDTNIIDGPYIERVMRESIGVKFECQNIWIYLLTERYTLNVFYYV